MKYIKFIGIFVANFVGVPIGFVYQKFKKQNKK